MSELRPYKLFEEWTAGYNREQRQIEIAGCRYPVTFDMDVEGYVIVGYVPPDKRPRHVYVPKRLVEPRPTEE